MNRSPKLICKIHVVPYQKSYILRISHDDILNSSPKGKDNEERNLHHGGRYATLVMGQPAVLLKAFKSTFPNGMFHATR
jgi:hypothetical protein